MERQSGSAPEQPAAKRARLMTVSVEDGDAGGGETSSPPAASPRSPKLRPAFLVVLFAVRMIVMNPVPTPPSITPSITQIEDTVQRIVNCAFDQFHEMVSSKLEKAFQAFQGQINSIHHEVRQMAFLCSNRHADQHTRLETNREDSTVNISNTNIRLRFLNEFKQPIYTDKNLIDKNNAAIKVAIFDGGLKITSGPLSKVKVEILVLRGEFCNNGRGNWTEEEFDNHIVQDEQGLLGTVRLTNGEVELSQIRFKKGTCMKNVIMAARVCKGENLALRVQEAIMKPVVVLDRRNEANEKRYPPSLDDDVFRLEEIARNGQYSKRLLEAEIVTVQGFLKALNKDPNKLREILQMGTKNTSWSNLIGHARKCVLEDMPELKRYQSEDGNVVLFFNRVHDLVGAEFDCGYVGSGNFNRAQKALVNKRKGSAYDKLEGIASDYVVKGNVPKQISTRTDADAGPSVPVGSAQQPDFPAIHLTASHGTGAVENSPHGNINNMTTPIYPNANNDSMISLPGNNTNTNHYQDYGTAPLNQPPIILDSNMPDWQDDFDLENLMNSHIFEQTSIDEFQVPMQGEGACFCLWLMSHSRRVPSMGRDLVALGFQIQVTAMTASKHRPYVVQLPAPPWIRNQILVRY